MPQHDSQRDHRIRNIVAGVLGDVWAIEPSKLDQIVSFLEMRAAGLELNEAEIQAAIRLQSRSSFEDLAAGLDTQGGDRLIADGVEVLQLMGTMAPRMNLMMEFSGGTSTQKLGQQIDRAMADPNVKAVLLEVDSPGGMMSGTEELRARILATRGKKRLVAVARGAVASAAYYVATAAEELIATPSTQVGSIGVFMITNDQTKLYEQLGVKFHVWRAGNLKFAGNQYESLTEDRAKSIQARVDGPYQMFLQAVAENRNVSIDKVKADFGQGTMFLAEEALRRGMIDRVAAIEDVFDELRKTSGVAKSMPATSPNTGYRVSGAEISAKENDSMNKKIKAQLFALGLVDDVNAADEMCQAALKGFFRGTVPSGDDAILKGLQGSAASTSTAVQDPPKQEDGQAKLQAKRDQELAEARAAERERIEALQAKAKILNSTGFAISEDQVRAATKEGLTPAEAADRWTKTAPGNASGGTGENAIGKVAPTGSEVDQFHAAASDGLMIRSQRQGAISLPKDYKGATGSDQASRMRAIDIARRDLQLAGRRVDPYADDETVATEWLKMHGEFRVMGAEGGVTAGNYPNLLSSFMNKSLEMSPELRETTYRQWTAQHPSVPDFNPRLVVGQSSLGYLPEIAGDGDKTPETSSTEEALAWFNVHRRGEKLKLTPYMITQDQLGAFADSLGKLSGAQDKTIDRMAFDLLLANPTLLDNLALFHTATHKNLLASGAAPSAAQAKALRLMMRTQPEIGGTDPLELEPRIFIVPDELEEAGIQTYYTSEKLTEIVMKTTDTGVNIYRDPRNIVIPSQRLSAASALIWYGLADPRIMPVIKRVFQNGYEGGKRETWWDPDTQCRYFRYEIRVAVFVAGWRGIVKNPGQ